MILRYAMSRNTTEKLQTLLTEQTHLVLLDQLRNPEAHFGETLLVTNGMGDTKKFPYEDVPQCLGGAKVLSSVAAAKDQ